MGQLGTNLRIYWHICNLFMPRMRPDAWQNREHLMTAKIHNLAEDGRKLRLAELWQQMKMPAFSHFEDETNFTLIDGIYHLVEARDRQESRILRNRQLALEMLAERGLPVPE